MMPSVKRLQIFPGYSSQLFIRMIQISTAFMERDVGLLYNVVIVHFWMEEAPY